MSSTTPFWRPDPSLAALPPSSSDHHFVIAPAGAAETEQVLKLFAACGAPGFDVVGVREVSNPRLTDGFHSRLAQLQTRSGNPPFRPKYQSEAHPSHRDAVIQVAKTLARPFIDTSFPDVSIVPVFHGTTTTVLPSILNGSFANLATTDAGYFGKGIYGTPDAEYAWRVYAKRGGVLLLCCFSFYSAYPVVGKSEMDKLNSMPSRENYDAHVVPVLPRNPLDPDEAVYYPAEAGAAALTTYMELVVFDSSQALPRYIVDVAPSSIPRPRISIPHPTPISGVISREVPLRYGMLFAGRDTDGPELLQVLTSLRNVDALKKHIETGEKERKDRQRRIKSQKIDASAEKLMKSSSDVAVGEQIGEGSSGVVHRAEAHYMGDVRVAVKRLKSNTPQLEAALKKEALVMMRVSSPFVVRVYGMLSAPLGIIMELVEQGSLHDHLQRRPFTVDEQFNLCRGMTCGLKSLHDAGILHCDLKGKNILLDDSFDSHKSFMPKITDFGIARVCAQSDTLAGGTLLSPGTVEWMAPELWREKPEFSAASDTYALGMVFYEILTRRNPWAAEMAELEKGQTPLARVPGWVLDGRRPKFEDVKDVDTVLAEIMVSCWKQQPSDRPSLAGILDKLRAESPSARAARAAEAERQRKIREAEERKVAEAKATEAERQRKIREAEERKATNSTRVRMQFLGQSYNPRAEAFLLDGRYCGDVDSENRPHGIGVFTFSEDVKNMSGFSIRGSFYEGFVHGQATVLRKDGKVYDGEFKFGLCHGQGELYKQDGSIFHHGEFENGRPKKEKKGEKKDGCVLQ